MSFDTFRKYFAAAGGCRYGYVAVVCVLVSVSARIAPDYYLSYWVRDALKTKSLNSLDPSTADNVVDQVGIWRGVPIV